jgi:hypothetical protein
MAIKLCPNPNPEIRKDLAIEGFKLQLVGGPGSRHRHASHSTLDKLVRFAQSAMVGDKYDHKS